MDGMYDGKQIASVAIAGLIRANNAGACSGEPHGVRYPGVRLGIDANAPMTEEQYYMACGCAEHWSE
jgi:hypothetical protein